MRSMWEFVFVSQFLRVFHGKFGFVRFTAEVRIKTIVCCKENTKSYGTRLILHFFLVVLDFVGIFSEICIMVVD